MSAIDKEGTPYALEMFPRSGGMDYPYVCKRCGALSRLTLRDFNALPVRTNAELEAYGLARVLSRDLVMGGDLTPEQARDLWRAGLTVPVVDLLTRRDVPPSE